MTWPAPIDLRDWIRTIPDHPRPGIMFRDITTLLADAEAFRQAVAEISLPFARARIAKVAGIEARGFILGGAVAQALGVGFVPLRKRGKLPGRTIAVEYALEYGVDALELHHDACAPGERILLVDDLIATGGTAEAAVHLLRQLGAEVVGASFVIDLPALGGAERIRRLGVEVVAAVAFDGH